ncbi:hypothetical protein Kfla_6659 [Kribbella flavida DSM 17836]|uniref:Uncharacterized protein n=1 Tax=Kribbella flavida (strain DSM 17836 / JCM 10339 / NBRC 14399) TaxID=479435 RepID=D2PZT5_KRIFD|nr:hypothetical protein Kfla_6659 [Kribbella flavida DSM 17836]
MLHVLDRLRPSPALIQSTRRRFYRVRSAVFRTIWPRDAVSEG